MLKCSCYIYRTIVLFVDMLIYVEYIYIYIFGGLFEPWQLQVLIHLVRFRGLKWCFGMLGFGSGNLLNDPYCTCLCSVSISSHGCLYYWYIIIYNMLKNSPLRPLSIWKNSLPRRNSECEAQVIFLSLQTHGRRCHNPWSKVRRQSAGLRWLNEGGSHFGWEKTLEITGPPSNG